MLPMNILGGLVASTARQGLEAAQENGILAGSFEESADRIGKIAAEMLEFAKTRIMEIHAEEPFWDVEVEADRYEHNAEIMALVTAMVAASAALDAVSSHGAEDDEDE